MSEEIQYRIEDSRAFFEIDETIFPIEAIFGASYLFVDHSYIFFSRSGDRKIVMTIKKKSGDGSELDALVGEFSNELLNQVLRLRLAESTAKIREYYMARAFLSHPAQSSWWFYVLGSPVLL